jgi:hypothetical protein
MAKRLLNLRNVPDDEADDLRALLGDCGYGLRISSNFWSTSGIVDVLIRLKPVRRAQPRPALLIAASVAPRLDRLSTIWP